MKLLITYSLLLVFSLVSYGQMKAKLIKTNKLIEVKKQYTKALVLVNEYIKYDSTNVEALWQRSVCLRKIGSYTEALENLKKAKDFEPQNYKVICELANVYALLGKHKLAVENYEKSVLLNSNYYRAYTSYGSYKFSFLNDNAGALDDFNKAIALNPKSSDALYNRAVVYYTYKKYDKAIEDLSKAIKLSPKDQQIYYERARCYKAKEMYVKAIRDFDKAIKFNEKIDPWEKINSGYIYFLRYQCHEMIGNTKKAKEDKAKAEEIGYSIYYLN